MYFFSRARLFFFHWLVDICWTFRQILGMIRRKWEWQKSFFTFIVFFSNHFYSFVRLMVRFFGIRAVYTVMSSTVRHVKHERERERKTTKQTNNNTHVFGPGYSLMSNIDMDAVFFSKGICTEAWNKYAIRERERDATVYRIENKSRTEEIISQETIEYKKRKKRYKNDHSFRGVDWSIFFVFFSFLPRGRRKRNSCFCSQERARRKKSRPNKRKTIEMSSKDERTNECETKRFSDLVGRFLFWCFRLKIISHWKIKHINQSRICRTAAADYFSFHPHLSWDWTKQTKMSET